MERGQSTKILRLVLNSVFVSLPPPFFFKLYSLSFSFLYSLKILKYASTAHSCRAMRAQYTWGLLIQKLNIIIFWALSPPHMHHFSICTFFRHYMHQYDLSFGQAGLPGCCVYAQRSR